MNNTVTETETDRRGKGNIKYVSMFGTTPIGITGGLQEEKLIRSYMPTMEMEIDEEFAGIYSSVPVTGEIARVVVPISKRIAEAIESAINLLDGVLEVYNDEIERINTFSLFEEKIKSLWELREEVNQNFVDVLVLLEVVVKNSHYQNYKKNQYQSIKTVLERIKGIHITAHEAKECRKLLMDNGIDFFAPIRDWENYTIEVKKRDETE